MITKTCLVCGKTFDVPPSRDRLKFCGRVCYTEYHASPPISKVCEVCGATFVVKAYRASTARFCSFACSGKWHVANRDLTHPHMPGNQLRKGLRPSNAFTSEQVRGANHPKWVAGDTFTCEHCGNVFTVKPWLVRQNGTPRFCSSACFRASGAFRGECSPLWVGGPTTYRGRGWLKARAQAVERDSGACQLCGKAIGSSIPVHHIRPFREFDTVEQANALDNLVCLCQSCHMRVETR